MRTLEYAILSFDLLLLVLLVLRFNRSQILDALTGLMTILVITLHLIVEGYRWQMVPAYLAAAGFMLALLLLSRSERPARSLAHRLILRGIPGLLLILLATALSALLPVPKLPEPSGRYDIGTTTFHVVDQNRPEIYGENPSGPRELMLQVWYPAQESSDGLQAPYFCQIDLAASVIAERLNLPAFFLGHLNLVKTNAEIDAPLFVKEGGFPILLFSHGLRGIKGQNTILFEELASHGYVIASADHTFDAIISILPNNRVVTHHGDSVFPESIPFQEAASQLVSVRTGDLQSVLEFLENASVDDQNILYGNLDLEHVGVMGHSTGGATAIEFCSFSTRCQAAIVLDGWLEPVSEPAISGSMEQPLMFISAEEWLGEENRSIGEQFIDQQKMAVYQLEVVDTEHYNYTDIPLLTPISPQIGLSGPIEPALSVSIVTRLSLAFFNEFLMDMDGDASSINELIDSYPKVILKNN